MSKASRSWKRVMFLYGVPKSHLTLKCYRKMRRNRGQIIRTTKQKRQDKMLKAIKNVDPAIIVPIANRLAAMQAMIRALVGREEEEDAED